jgi:hypothetical protein
MQPPVDDMMDLDRPVTRRELRTELEAVLKTLATKEDLTAFATKEELKAFATKEDLKAFATKEELKAFATKEDLKAGLREVRDELRTHFDVVAESFRSQFGYLHDWVEANTTGVATRVEQLERGHGARLLSLEGRVTNLENRGTKP